MVLLALSGAFGLCLVVGLMNGESIADPSINAFSMTIVLSLLLATILYWLGSNGKSKLYRREALCAIGLSWFVATLIGALPYALSVENCHISDAIFESSSGLTTTGATAFENFDTFPKSLLFWRSLSQWFGGLGVVVFFGVSRFEAEHDRIHIILSVRDGIIPPTVPLPHGGVGP